MDNASLRSYIVYHDQSGLSRPNLWEKWEIIITHISTSRGISIYNVVNVFKALKR
jgi:hypothetical protein